MSDVREIPQNLVRTEEFIGVKVKNLLREDLGKIEDVVLDKLNGQACYVVLSFGGILGLGDKLFALPWKALRYDANEKCFTLDVEKDKLKNAPGFDKDNWPNMADTAWSDKINTYYGSRRM